MRARVHVTLKTGVLDPQGEAIRNALGGLGFDGIDAVRQGKVRKHRRLLRMSLQSGEQGL